MNKLFPILVLVMLSACTVRDYYWVHDTKSSARFYQEKNHCIVKSRQVFPPNSKGIYGADTNIHKANVYYRDCLKSFGWSETYDEKELTIF